MSISVKKRKPRKKRVRIIFYEQCFPKQRPKEGERLCPYEGIPYSRVPGYESVRGCPICKAIGEFHLPVNKEVADRFPRGVKKKIK